MTIEKSTMFLGRYIASQKVGNRWLVGVGGNHTEAMLDLFRNLKWLDIGKWPVFKNRAEEDLEVEEVRKVKIEKYG